MFLESFAWFGLAAGLILLCGVLGSLKDFTGMKHERYSMLDHFISELGDPRFAPRKTLFNITLILGGIVMIPFIVGIGLFFNSILGYMILGLGVVCSIFCSLIGCFPENYVKAHFTIAGIFFVGMGFLMLLSAITIFVQYSLVPAWLGYLTLFLLIPFLSFIIDTLALTKEELKLTDTPWAWDPNERPKFWRNPFLEWVAFFAILLWIFLIAFFFIDIF